MITFTLKDPRVDLGYIPDMLWPSDPRPASEQINERYSYGGGWMPMKGWKMLPDGNLQYGDPSKEDADPPTILLAEGKLRDETIRFYTSAWVAIVQPDGSFEVSRMD